MRVLRLALAGVITIGLPIAAYADGQGRNGGPAIVGPVPGIARTGAGPALDTFSAIGSGGPITGQIRQGHSGRASPHWRHSLPPQAWVPFGWPGVPPYWVWGPSGGGFDYPFADWRGPTGGWGNP
jgi:hypothetical protein